jgi:hypothetical protein
MRRNHALQAAEAADLMRQNVRDATERGEKLAELADRSEVPRKPQARGQHARQARSLPCAHARGGCVRWRVFALLWMSVRFSRMRPTQRRRQFEHAVTPMPKMPMT